MTDVRLEGGVLYVQYNVVHEALDGRHCVETQMQWFEGEDAIAKELERNAEASALLTLKIEALLEGNPQPTAPSPTFAVADKPDRHLDKF